MPLSQFRVLFVTAVVVALLGGNANAADSFSASVSTVRLAKPLITGPIDDPHVPVVLYVHGGGWVYTGSRVLNPPTVQRWRREPVAVWSTDYRPGRQSLQDVLAAYRSVRRRVGARRRVCLDGESSGGELALIVAARNRSVNCVISNSGVVDLSRVPPRSPLRPIVVNELLAHGGLDQWDPFTNARRITQPTLLIHHLNDPVVPISQSRRLLSRLPRASLIELPQGPSDGPASYHGPHTTIAADARAWRASVRLVSHPSPSP